MSDLEHLLNMLHNHWPDFKVQKKDFKSPTPEYIQHFYVEVYNEFRNRLNYILNGESMHDEFEHVVEQGYDPGVQIYCQMAKLFRKLNSSIFNLTDIYQPVPKRTIACARLAMHFLVYIANLEDSSALIVSESFKKLQIAKELESEKQDCIQEINANIQNIPINEDELENLRKQLEIVNQEYEKMLDKKMLKDKLLSTQNTELEKLQLECDNLEYELKRYEENNAKLQEEIVTKEEFDNLTSISNYLDTELEKLSTDDFDYDDNLNEQKDTLNQLEQIIKLLSTINFDVLNVNELMESEEQLKLTKEQHSKIIEESNSLMTTNKTLENYLETLQTDLDNYIKDIKQLKEINQSEIEVMNKKIIDNYDNITHNRKYEEKLNDVIKELQIQIKHYENEQTILKQTCAEEYKNCLQMLNKVYLKVNEFLVCVKEKGNIY